MSVETRLIELIGDAGKRLHTARSRNDQLLLILDNTFKNTTAFIGCLGIFDRGIAYPLKKSINDDVMGAVPPVAAMRTHKPAMRPSMPPASNCAARWPRPLRAKRRPWAARHSRRAGLCRLPAVPCGAPAGHGAGHCAIARTRAR